jgi:hypothetical protein
MEHSKPIVVCFVGHIGSGKTTLANFLCSNPVHKAVRVSLAQPLRKVIELVYGIEESAQRDPEKKSMQWEQLGGKTLREVLQKIGTECFRSINKDTWVNKLIDYINKDYYSVRNWKAFGETFYSPLRHGVYIIDDLRFVNEFEALLKEFPGNLIMVHLAAATDPVYSHKWERIKQKLNIVLPKFLRLTTQHDSVLEIDDVVKTCRKLSSSFGVSRGKDFYLLEFYNSKDQQSLQTIGGAIYSVIKQVQGNQYSCLTL